MVNITFPNKTQLFHNTETGLVHAAFCSTPFQQGSIRKVYKGVYGEEDQPGSCVVKVYPRKQLREQPWQNDVMVSKKAKRMAHQYSTKTGNAINFIVPEITTICKSELPDASPGTTVVVEEYIDGDFVKFNSNLGFVRDGDEAAVAGEFSHFTYDVTDGREIVVDIQGTKNGTGYKLTDPAMHSCDWGISKGRQARYGPTDIGAIGIIIFFLTHDCTPLCSRWKKPNLPEGVKASLANRLTACFGETKYAGLKNDLKAYIWDLPEKTIADISVLLKDLDISRLI